jgi:hypothetical protein
LCHTSHLRSGRPPREGYPQFGQKGDWLRPRCLSPFLSSAGRLRSEATTPPGSESRVPCDHGRDRSNSVLQNSAPNASDNTRHWEVWGVWVRPPTMPIGCTRLDRRGIPQQGGRDDKPRFQMAPKLSDKPRAQRVRQLPTMGSLEALGQHTHTQPPCSRQAHIRRPAHRASQLIQTQLSKNNTCGSFTGNRPTYPEEFAWVNGGSWMDGSIPSTTCQEPRLSRSGIGPDRQSITDPTRIPHPQMHAPLN